MTSEIVRRLEAAERDAYADLYAAVPDDVRTALGVEHRRIGDGLVIACRAIPQIMLNRIFALGVTEPARAEAIDDGLALLERTGASRPAIQVAPGAVALADLAVARGFAHAGQEWAKFALSLDEPPADASTDLPIREIGPDEAGAFGEAVAGAFGMPPPVRRWIEALVGRVGWRMFVAFDGTTPVGAGVLRSAGGTGWLGMGGTIASHRGRGIQRAILARRLAEARAAGATLATTETGIPAPDEAGPSFKNIQRAGFRIAYVRPNYRRD